MAKIINLLANPGDEDWIEGGHVTPGNNSWAYHWFLDGMAMGMTEQEVRNVLLTMGYTVRGTVNKHGEIIAQDQ